jgi:hypothetical protein
MCIIIYKMYSVIGKRLLSVMQQPVRAYSTVSLTDIEQHYKGVKRFTNFIGGNSVASAAHSWYPVHNPVH